ncbi:MAG: hypothetical protein LE180_04390 [Endomicrobium sp.]|nr:hypothetical protein [Endomicrobium sp.]
MEISLISSVYDKFNRKNLNKTAKYNYRPFHKADIVTTWANIDKAKKLLNWSPKVSLYQGTKKTVDWYLENKYWFKNVKL